MLWYKARGINDLEDNVGIKFRKSLYKRAIEEIEEALRVSTKSATKGDLKKGPLRKEARKILRERIQEATKMRERFEENLKDARIKAHSDALREGHEKDMRWHLRASPGTSKDTAKSLIKALLGSS